MTDQDDALRDMVRRAHQADPDSSGFDVTAGLADLRARAAARPAPAEHQQDPPAHTTGFAGVQQGFQSAATTATSANGPRSRGSEKAVPGLDLPFKTLTRPLLPAAPDLVESRSLVRPYARTGGRTRSTRELRLETLVATIDHGKQGSYQVPEFQTIADLCVQPRAIAEIAALMHLPYGVVCVLVSDLADIGGVTVHTADDSASGRPKIALMERVLRGLRALDNGSGDSAEQPD